jgi:transcriptional regulator with XRE-family HTH domain
MAQTPRALEPYSSLRHFFGAELRRWRTVRGLSQDEVGRRTHHSGDLIGKVEKAERRPTIELAASCDHVLATDGALSRLMGLVLAQDGGSTFAQSASTDHPIRPDGTVQRAEESHIRGESHRDRGMLRAASDWHTSVSAPDFIRLAGAAWFGMLPVDYTDPPGSALVLMGIPDRIEPAHVGALRRSTTLFENWDHQFGGGLARAAMSGQLEWSCQVLRGSSMTSEIRRGWQSATARLGDLVGWACFDAGEDEAVFRTTKIINVSRFDFTLGA